MSQETSKPATTTLTGILPKLSPEQRQKIETLTDREIGWTNSLLREDGADYFIKNFDALWHQLEYTRTLT